MSIGIMDIQLPPAPAPAPAAPAASGVGVEDAAMAPPAGELGAGPWGIGVGCVAPPPYMFFMYWPIIAPWAIPPAPDMTCSVVLGL